MGFVSARARSHPEVCPSKRARFVGHEPEFFALTPMKNATKHLDRYFSNLAGLDYETSDLSLGFLVSDSDDGTYGALEERLPDLREQYARVTLTSHDFGLRIPGRNRTMVSGIPDSPSSRSRTKSQSPAVCRPSR